MSDFMLWLHANYIKPQLDATPKQDYDFHPMGKPGQSPGIHSHPSLPPGPPHRGRTRPQPSMKAATRPRVLGAQTAVTSMVSPYSTFSTLASL